MPDFAWPHQIRVTPNLIYGSDDPAQQQLDIHSQTADAVEKDGVMYYGHSNKTLVFIHGGGWIEHDRISHTPWLISFLERGWNVVNVEYRLGPDTAPQAVDDVMQALHWLGKNGREYGIDCRQLVVGGCSAGGHLALISAYLNAIPGSHLHCSADIDIACVMNWCGITNIETLEAFLQGQTSVKNYASLWAGNQAPIAELGKNYWPVHHITPQTPPTVTIHGDTDLVVPYQQAEQLHQLLEKQGVSHKLVPIKGGGHGGFTPRQWSYSYNEMFAFIDRYTQ